MGTLYVVGTPIGNLEDITYRALRVLREVDLVAAEDTRHTRKLLTHFDISKPLFSYHEHNIQTAGQVLLNRISAGSNVALVTDAGMPGISDPGQHLIKMAVESDVPVVVVPGPTAAITGLVVSGLTTDRFCFEGFLPRHKRSRAEMLERLAREPRTWILYEAPHRLLETLDDLAKQVGSRQMTACRELTKKFEEVRRGTPAQLAEHFRQYEPRGEFTLVVSGAPVAENQPEDAVEITPERLAAEVAALETQGEDRKVAMKAVATRYGLSKRDVYQALLDLKEDG